MSYFTMLLSSQAHPLRLPTESRDDVERYVLQHQKGRAEAEHAPFRRQLDFWAFCIATAVAADLQPLAKSSSVWGRKFVDTRAVQMPDDLCDLLAVLALKYLGPEHDGLDDPSEIVEVGNRLAGAGCPELLAKLNSLDLRVTTLDKALEFAAQMLRH